jgi:hypothetical protein
MGMDFIDKTKKSLKKGWDKSRADLCAPDLLRRFPNEIDRHFLADALPNNELAVGEELIVQCDSARLAAYRGTIPVAYFRQPPEELVKIIREDGCCAAGTVAEVYEMSQTVAITIH